MNEADDGADARADGGADIGSAMVRARDRAMGRPDQCTVKKPSATFAVRAAAAEDWQDSRSA